MREQSLVLAAVFSGAPIPLLSFLLCQTWKGRQSLFWKCRGLLWSWECCLKGQAEAQWQFCTRWCWPHWCRKSFRCDFCSDTGQMFYSWLSSLFNHHTDDVLIEVLLIASVSISVCVCVFSLPVFLMCNCVCHCWTVYLRIWFSSFQCLCAISALMRDGTKDFAGVHWWRVPHKQKA